MSSTHCRCSSTAPDGTLTEAGREEVRHLAGEAGAVACGFAVAAETDADADARYDAWTASGSHAGMTYMERNTALRRDPRTLLDGARTVMVMAFSYAPSHRHPLFSDYALGDDYHDVLRSAAEAVAGEMRARHGGDTRICVDTAPLRERYWAVRAGLGFIGLNNQLIIPGFGSKVFLTEILWTVGVPPDAPCEASCLRCGACVRACPGRALHPDGAALDARRCLSYLTIEHRGDFPDGIVPDLHGRRIYGCDICQDVCPHNDPGTLAAAAAATLPQFAMRPAIDALRTPDDVAALTAETFATTFRGSAVKRAKLAGLLRNAAAIKKP